MLMMLFELREKLSSNESLTQSALAERLRIAQQFTAGFRDENE